MEGTLLLLFFSAGAARGAWVPASVGNPALPLNPPSVAQTNDPFVLWDRELSRFRMYFGLVGAAGGPVAHVGHALSTDSTGDTWGAPEIVFSPVGGSSGAWDSTQVEIPSVVFDQAKPSGAADRFRMFYGGAAADGITKLGMALSPDGLNWTRLDAGQSLSGKAGLVMEPGFSPGDAGVIAEPSVIADPGNSTVLHMLFNSFGWDELVISYANSTDGGVTWTKVPRVLFPSVPWEQTNTTIAELGTVAQPALFLDSSSMWHCWYGSFDDVVLGSPPEPRLTYTGIGHAVAPNPWGPWSRTNNALPVLVANSSLPGEEIGIGTGPEVVRRPSDDSLHLFVGTVPSTYLRRISHYVQVSTDGSTTGASGITTGLTTTGTTTGRGVSTTGSASVGVTTAVLATTTGTGSVSSAATLLEALPLGVMAVACMTCGDV
jgi:hypothetical protein